MRQAVKTTAPSHPTEGDDRRTERQRHIMASTTDEKIARENRLRLFKDQGELAMKEAAEEAIAVRLNMARLRELRLEKEAETGTPTLAVSSDKSARPSKRRLKRRVY